MAQTHGQGEHFPLRHSSDPRRDARAQDRRAGSGTTGQVALELGRRTVLIELNPDYVKLIKQRCAVTPGLAL